MSISTAFCLISTIYFKKCATILELNLPKFHYSEYFKLIHKCWATQKLISKHLPKHLGWNHFWSQNSSLHWSSVAILKVLMLGDWYVAEGRQEHNASSWTVMKIKPHCQWESNMLMTGCKVGCRTGRSEEKAKLGYACLHCSNHPKPVGKLFKILLSWRVKRINNSHTWITVRCRAFLNFYWHLVIQKRVKQNLMSDNESFKLSD